MAADDDHRTPAAKEPDIFVAGVELDDVGTVVEPELPPHLDDFGDQAEEVDPHPADDVVDFEHRCTCRPNAWRMLSRAT